MLQFVVHKFCLAKVRKTAQKKPRQSLEIGCEGVSLKVVSYFI